MKKNLFTLVELLVVIAILGILSAMILPVLSGATEKAEVAKAKAGVTTLYNAIKQYESTYGALPIPSSYRDGKTNANKFLDDDAYTWLILLLQGEEISASSNKDYKDYGLSVKYNKRGTAFLDVQGSEPGVYKDPWDKNYEVIFDSDYDGKISTDVPGLVKAKDSKNNTLDYRYSFIVYSKGPDGKIDEDSKGAKANKDNVYSMPTTAGDGGHSQDK